MWRRITKLLHLHGPLSVGVMLDELTAGSQELDAALRECIRLGTVRRVDVGRYDITLMGRAWVEGAVELRTFRPGGAAWCATWIQPLPRYAA
jgi:myo-inositol catabolism protein IolC